MTTGRTGSTALMDAIAASPDVAVPGRQLDCRDHELMHPLRGADYALELGARLGRPVLARAGLVDAFFELNGDRPFAGFKSMPDRHEHLEAFVRRADIRIITLRRRDIVATAASFLLAMTRGTWRRDGGRPPQRLRLDAALQPRLQRSLRYLRDALRALDAIPDAICLDYEDLCEQDFASPALDRFFGRPVRLARPRGATRAEDYVDDFDAFETFVHRCWAEH